MEEIVSSAIVHDTVNKIVSGLIDKYERKSNAEEHMERLEMAHIKLEATLEISYKWQITDAPLLCWQKKLKRAAEECDDTLRKCRQRVQKELMEQEVHNSSFTKRIARATKSLMSSIFNGNTDESSRSVVRRFEWFADGANDFLRFLEFGGTPRGYLFFDPLIRHLLEGEMLEYKLVQGNKRYLFSIRPCNIAGRGAEARLIFVYKDSSAPEDNFFFGMTLQLSESTNIVGIILKCLQLFTPHFKSTTETVRKVLTQLPTQDFSWVPYVDSCHKEHWDNIHNISTLWFCPNPLCCKQHGQKICGSSNMDKLELPNVYLEPVIQVYLEHQVSLSRCNEQRSAVQGKRSSLRRLSHLRLGVNFLPHGSSNELLPTIASSAVEVINGVEKHCCHTNISLEELDEFMLPKMIDSFSRNAEATAYQMIWKSEHEAAYFHLARTRMEMPSTQRITREGRKVNMLQRQDLELESRANVIADTLNLWAAHAPIQLQGSLMDWIQKEKETQLAPPQLRLKY